METWFAHIGNHYEMLNSLLKKKMRVYCISLRDDV